MLFKKIRQNLAGFAIVALVFTGFSAVSQANASNPGALADTNQLGFDVYNTFTMSGATGTAVVPQSVTSQFFSTRIDVTAAGSASLASGALTIEITGTGPGGAIAWQSAGYMNQFYAYPPGTPYLSSSNGTMTWPASTTGSTGYINYDWYNNAGTLAAGTYTLSAVLRKNGTVVPFSSDISVSMSLRYDSPGQTIAAGTGISPRMWRSGYVCVDMTGIAAGDVLNAAITSNGAAINSSTISWTSNGWTPYANGASFTVTSAAVTNGAIVLDFETDYGHTVVTGATYDVTIKKGAVEVSKSCAPATPSVAPIVAISSNGMSSQFTATINPVNGATSGYDCILYDSNSVAQFSGSAMAGATTCNISVWGNLNSASYTVKYRGRGVIEGPLSPTSAIITPLVATFDVNGGTGTAPVAINHWGSFTAPGGSGITRSGYNFNGWATSANAITPSVFSGSQVSTSSSQTYYAVWNQSGGGQSTPTCPGTFTSIHATNSVLTPSGSFSTYFNNNPTMTNCVMPQISGGGTRVTLNGTVLGTPFFNMSVGFITNSTPRTLSQLLASPNFSGITVQDGDVYRVSYYQGLSGAPSANDVAFTSYSITLYPSGNVQNNNVVTPINSVPTTIPLVRPTLALSQTVRAGGTLVIDAANAASVSEIKVGGVAAKLEKVTAGVEIQVPTGLTPGAKDLFIKTDTGSTLHVGAIKIADPIVEAAKLAYAKAASTVAFRAPIDQAVAGARPSAKQVAEARAHAVEYKTAKEAVCVAVPASKATASSARAAATALCAAMKSVNRKLKVTIIVEAPSGDKTNVVTSELIG